MTANMGRTDRTLRLGVAVVLFVLAFFLLDGIASWIAGGIGVILAATAFVGTCPAYLPFGLSTRRQRS